eukprot:311010_1
MLSIIIKQSNRLSTRSIVTLIPKYERKFVHQSILKTHDKYELIETAEDGEKWMERIEKKVLSNSKKHDASNNDTNAHYSQQLNNVNDNIWFGVDTEFSKNEQRRSQYNNTQICMLQIYGDNTCDQSKCIMDKPVIFQLYDIENDKINNDLLSSIKPFLTDPMYSKVFHNYSVDAHVINNALRDLNPNNTNDNQHKLTGFAADTMHMARLLDAGSPENSLKALSMKYNPNGTFKAQTLKEYSKTIFDQELLPQQIQNEMKMNPNDWYEYASADPVVTFELACKMKELLLSELCILQLYDTENECKLWNIYESIWRPFGELLVEIESNGFYIDLKYLQKLEKNSIAEREKYIQQFKEWAINVTGDNNLKYMNCQSKVQLGYLFFGDDKDEISIKITKKTRAIDSDAPQSFLLPNLGFESIDKTPKGRIKFTGKILDELIETPHGLSAHFSDINERKDAIECVNALRKAISIGTQINTFILPLQKYVSENDKRLHYELNLNTETGRLSCRNPNLQNQPSHTDIFAIRKCFTPQINENNILIIGDYAQIELRVLAYLSNCESMIDAFESGGDFHSRTAVSMYSYIQNDINKGGVLLDGNNENNNNILLVKDKYKRERMHAKMINFSIAYGKTAQGLATDLDISTKEANEILEKWYSDRIEVKIWQQKQMLGAIENGYSYSLIGRKRQLFDPVNDICNGNNKLHQQFINFVRETYNINGHNNENLNIKQNKIRGKNKKMSSLWQKFVKQYKTNEFCDDYEDNIDDNINDKINLRNTELNTYMRRAINSPVQSS